MCVSPDVVSCHKPPVAIDAPGAVYKRAALAQDIGHVDLRGLGHSGAEEFVAYLLCGEGRLVAVVLVVVENRETDSALGAAHRAARGTQRAS